jgi:hypothetical protein
MRLVACCELGKIVPLRGNLLDSGSKNQVAALRKLFILNDMLN